MEAETIMLFLFLGLFLFGILWILKNKNKNKNPFPSPTPTPSASSGYDDVTNTPTPSTPVPTPTVSNPNKVTGSVNDTVVHLASSGAENSITHRFTLRPDGTIETASPSGTTKSDFWVVNGMFEGSDTGSDYTYEIKSVNINNASNYSGPSEGTTGNLGMPISYQVTGPEMGDTYFTVDIDIFGPRGSSGRITLDSVMIFDDLSFN